MRLIRRAVERAMRQHELAKRDQLGFDAGLTLLEVAAAVGVSIILALTITLALTGLFTSAKSSSEIQTLTNVVTAINAYNSANNVTVTCPAGSIMCLGDSSSTVSAMEAQATGVSWVSTMGASGLAPNQVYMAYAGLPGLVEIMGPDAADASGSSTIAIYEVIDLLQNVNLNSQNPPATCFPTSVGPAGIAGPVIPAGIYWTRIVVNMSAGLEQYTAYTTNPQTMLNSPLQTINPCH